MKFGDLRQMIDRTARIQICDHVSGDYMDYRFVEDVPHENDSRTVFGKRIADDRGNDGISSIYHIINVPVRIYMEPG